MPIQSGAVEGHARDGHIQMIFINSGMYDRRSGVPPFMQLDSARSPFPRVRFVCGTLTTPISRFRAKLCIPLSGIFTR